MPKPQKLLIRGVRQSRRDVQDSFETASPKASRIRSQSLGVTLPLVYPVHFCVWLAAGAIECLPASVRLLVWLVYTRGSERIQIHECVPLPTADGEPPVMIAFTIMRESTRM